MKARLNDRVFKCCETVVEHFVVMDEVKKNSEIYADEHDLAVAILASCILECIKKKIQNFNHDVARGLLYCALSQLTCAEESTESDFNKYASMLVDVYEAGMKEIG